MEWLKVNLKYVYFKKFNWIRDKWLKQGWETFYKGSHFWWLVSSTVCIETVFDPWTIKVWSVSISLYADFKKIVMLKYLHHPYVECMIESVDAEELHIQRNDYKWMDFQLHRRSVSLSLMLFKAQLNLALLLYYIHKKYINEWAWLCYNTALPTMRSFSL